MKIKITDNTGNKRIKAQFIEDGKVKKTVNFGMKGSKGTFADGATEQKKKAYLARHSKMGEDWTKSGLKTAGFLSRWVLWSDRSNAQIKKNISKVSGIPTKDISINFTRQKVS
tara:strand:- start:498 stop:836 length:339 start_codon:yes stop_codon:yes gene_type:complete